MHRESSITRESLKDKDKYPQFSHYSLSAHRMMEKMGYNLTKGLAWTSVEEDKHYFDLSCQEGKPPITTRKLEGD